MGSTSNLERLGQHHHSTFLSKLAARALRIEAYIQNGIHFTPRSRDRPFKLTKDDQGITREAVEYHVELAAERARKRDQLKTSQNEGRLKRAIKAKFERKAKRCAAPDDTSEPAGRTHFGTTISRSKHMSLLSNCPNPSFFFHHFAGLLQCATAAPSLIDSHRPLVQVSA